jgi:hypothetical protein
VTYPIVTSLLASGVIFAVQNLHKKMMRVKSMSNQFSTFWLSVEENIRCVNLVGRRTTARRFSW